MNQRHRHDYPSEDGYRVHRLKGTIRTAFNQWIYDTNGGKKEDRRRSRWLAKRDDRYGSHHNGEKWPTPEAMLDVIREMRKILDFHERQAVDELREVGYTWQQIVETMGASNPDALFVSCARATFRCYWCNASVTESTTPYDDATGHDESCTTLEPGWNAPETWTDKIKF